MVAYCFAGSPMITLQAHYNNMAGPPSAPLQALAGRSSDGKFHKHPAKAYPPRICELIARSVRNGIEASTVRGGTRTEYMIDIQAWNTPQVVTTDVGPDYAPFGRAR